MRRIGSRIRNGLEAAVCIPLFLIEVVLCGAVWLGSRAGRRDAEEHRRFLGFLGTHLRRWKQFAAHGFPAIRRAWWPVPTLERWRVFYRYLFLLELVELWNLGRMGLVRRIPRDPRVLAIKLGHFGDALHVVPMLRALEPQVPPRAVTLLAGPWASALTERLQDKVRVVSYAPQLRQFRRTSAGRRAGVWAEISLLRRLRRTGFSHVISTSTTGLVEFLIMRSCAAESAVYVETALTELYGPLGEEHTVPYRKHVYEAERIMDLLGLLGFSSGPAELVFDCTPDEREYGQRFRSVHGLEGAAPLFVLAPGSGWAGKCWPPEHFAALGDMLIRRYGGAAVIAGSPDERELAERVCSAMREPFLNIAGETTLGQLAALIGESTLLVGNDSAPLHLAVCAGTPSVSLFGPTSEDQWVPRDTRHRVIRSPAACGKCSPWHPAAACVAPTPCMQAIAVDDVFEEIVSLIASLPAKQTASESLKEARHP